MTEHRYRLLDHHEVIELGDQVLNDDCQTWGGLVGWEVGMVYEPGVMVPIRRATTPAEAVSPGIAAGDGPKTDDTIFDALDRVTFPPDAKATEVACTCPEPGARRTQLCPKCGAVTKAFADAAMISTAEQEGRG